MRMIPVIGLRALKTGWLCVVGLFVLSVQETIAIPPDVGSWEYRICRSSTICDQFNQECQLWDLGTVGPACGACLDPQDPQPWTEEDKLLPKANAFGTGAYWSRYWMSAGETNNNLYGFCWTGSPQFKLGIEWRNIGTIGNDAGNTAFSALREREVKCPAGTVHSGNNCLRLLSEDPYKNNNQCPLNSTNPIHTFTGLKLQAEDDYRGSEPFSLVFRRYFTANPRRQSAARPSKAGHPGSAAAMTPAPRPFTEGNGGAQ